MDEFTDDKPQLTDIQEGLRDVIRFHEELGWYSAKPAGGSRDNSEG